MAPALSRRGGRIHDDNTGANARACRAAVAPARAASALVSAAAPPASLRRAALGDAPPCSGAPMSGATPTAPLSVTVLPAAAFARLVVCNERRGGG